MLKAVNLSFAYPGQEVLKDISLEVNSGDFLGILGPNGTGKSTLFKLLTGVLNPRNGEITLENRSLKDFSRLSLARKMAVVPQEGPGDFPFTCREYVMMGRFPYLGFLGAETPGDWKLVAYAMEQTQTSGLVQRRLNQLSGGERQRVTLARALTQQGDLLLLDEPISHLDIGFQLETMEILTRINREQKTTIILILHDLNLAARFCRKLILLHQGRIFAQGKAAEVLTPESLESVFRVKTQITVKDGIPVISLEESCRDKVQKT